MEDSELCIDCHEAPRLHQRRYCKTCNYKRKKHYVDEWKANNDERAKEHARESRKRRYGPAKLNAIEYLGGKCVRCGFDNYVALTIDHPDGGGTDERQHMDRIRFYRLIAEGKITHVQLLCLNCHALKTAIDLI